MPEVFEDGISILYVYVLYLSLSLYTSAVTYIIYDLNVRQNLIRSTAVFGAG
jgi:hypothetical protein